MNVPEDDRAFLSELVKRSRQKPFHVSWVDRDGTNRVTTFSQAELARLTALAQKLRIGLPELMRQAAHIPAAAAKPGVQPVAPGSQLNPPAQGPASLPAR